MCDRIRTVFTLAVTAVVVAKRVKFTSLKSRESQRQETAGSIRDSPERGLDVVRVAMTSDELCVCDGEQRERAAYGSIRLMSVQLPHPAHVGFTRFISRRVQPSPLKLHLPARVYQPPTQSTIDDRDPGSRYVPVCRYLGVETQSGSWIRETRRGSRRLTRCR